MKRYAILIWLVLASVCWGQGGFVPLDNQKLAPIRIRKTNGTEIVKGLGASSATALGDNLVSANSAATAGSDTIAVGPGTFTVPSGSYLNKSLNYELAPGCIISKIANQPIIYDNSGAITVRITGGGLIRSNSTASTGTPLGYVVHQTNANSDVSITCEEFGVYGSAGNESIDLANGTLSIDCKRFYSNTYDGIIQDGGTFYLDADTAFGSDNLVEMGGGQCYVTAHYAHAEQSEVFYIDGDTNSYFSVRADKIVQDNPGTAGISGSAVTFGNAWGGDGYVNCPNISGYIGIFTSDASASVFLDNCNIDSTGNNYPTINLTSVSGFNALTLCNVNLTTKSSETYSVNAAGASTITVIGNLKCNKSIGSNVTFTGPGRVTAAGVVVYDGGRAANVLSLLACADYSAMRTALSLVPNTNFYAPAGTDVAVADGGTNTSSYTKGDILVASASTTLTKLPVGTDNQILIADAAQATGVKWGANSGGTGAPTDATYITQTANGSLSAEQSLSSLATGLMKVTTTTGVVTSVTDSAGLAGCLSNETGTGSVVFSTTASIGEATLDQCVIDNSEIGTTTPANGDFIVLRSVGSVNARGVQVTNHQLTGSNASSPVDVASTWNTSGTPTGIKLNVTDTASNAGSLLADLQVGGASKFKVAKDGTITVATAIPGSQVATATTTTTGAVEDATAAETTTGSDTARCVTPDSLRGSDYGKCVSTIFISPDIATTAMTTGDGKGLYFRVPSKLNAWNLVEVAASCNTASSSGIPTFQIRRLRSATPADMLTTKVTIDANETDSSTAATAAVIDTANDDVNTADRIYFDCDVAGTGTAGVEIQLTFQKP